MDKVNILGVEVSAMTHDQTINTLIDAVDNDKKKFVVTANPEIILHAYENRDYFQELSKADIITADGIGVVKGAKLLGRSIPERVTGFDLFISLLRKADQKGNSIYLLGAKEAVLNKTVTYIEEQYPNIKIVGKHNGYFDWEDPSIAKEIAGKKPDFVFVALGFPRQEKWIGKYIEQFNKGVFIGIGGSFDVLAGEVKRAPEIWQRLNLEWLYRLMKQPSRWRRMLALPRFVFKLYSYKQR
ncbi:N-acetylglucosaminyldiphosphoundecaprenol N-acetyl-beta-D-mannosaminyltransferase [Evansella vedderi]|uniref:N-acetylglucosaminyldiphosphoundecaprenol N-acetyl-beta-D-mannosaminyltransferase n=1 Tax=Evansella vedderi TaxID=38282 RepID=A0ABT9ZU94_9BACI|nr:WecB/TagA/CpsF family glycosyltransferase [Evansella vedderi]MDQ0254510.1 N-acetylglucosaminyldiphosphoundecaprenol N-acetyl-beta-D-mannosaminyltransferase [Evansella vedderi]